MQVDLNEPKFEFNHEDGRLSQKIFVDAQKNIKIPESNDEYTMVRRRSKSNGYRKETFSPKERTSVKTKIELKKQMSFKDFELEKTDEKFI